MLLGIKSAVFGEKRPNYWTPALLTNAGLMPWVGANLLVLILYFALGAIVSAFFAAYGLFPAPIWLPTSVATIAAMIGGFGVLPGIFLGSFVTNAVLFDAPFHIATIISTTNALGPVLGVALLQRLRPARGLFNSFPGVIAFIVCTTFISPAISATGGAVAMALGQPFNGAQFYSMWVSWWLTDGGGTLYLAPAVILWLGLEREPEARASILPGFQRRDLAVWAWIAVVSLALFLTPPLRGTYIRSAFPFLLVVPLSWIALRMSLRSAYTLVSLVAVVATAGTVAGYGPFQDNAMANPLQLVGTLVVLLATNVLTIVALVSERQEAEDANKAKSMLLAHTSHELRTPLNAIIGFSQLLSSDDAGPLDSPHHADYVAMIQTSGAHLLALINGLLDISKIEAGRFDLQTERIALRATVEQAIALLRLQADAKSITLHTDLTCGELAIDVDARAWQQILLNLISNAVKYTLDNGKVGLTVLRAANGDLLVRIWDTGIGIPAEAQGRIFKPFERVEGHKKRGFEGTGLGLSITRGLVTLHGGSIGLESKPGEGTTVTVTIPASRVFGAAMKIAS